MTTDAGRTAKQKAAWKWHPDVVARIAAVPWPCPCCRRGFRTKRGVNQHERSCWKNPRSKYFASGQYDMLIVRVGDSHIKVLGSVWNGTDDFHRLRIGRELSDVTAALGLSEFERMSYQTFMNGGG